MTGGRARSVGSAVVISGGKFGLFGEAFEKLLALAPALAPLLAIDLRRQGGELFDGEQAAAAVDQGTEPLVKVPPLGLRNGGVAPGMDLGGQMKTGLLHLIPENLAEDLQVKGQMAIESGVGRIQLLS